MLAALTVGLLAGAALAGDGNGKGKSGNPPGQQKKDQADTATTAAATPQDTAQAHGNPSAPGQENKASQPTGSNAGTNGQSKQTAKAAAKQPTSPSSHD